MRKQRQLTICRMATLLFLCIFSSLIVTAQQKTITGKITDAKTKEPVTNASIFIKGKSTGGTFSDDTGAFFISASPGDRLQIEQRRHAVADRLDPDVSTVDGHELAAPPPVCEHVSHPVAPVDVPRPGIGV